MIFFDDCAFYLLLVGEGSPIELELVSISPRVFSVSNFMSADEADQFIDLALNLSSDEFKLKRSSTGVAMNKNTKSKVRTSQNAFDTTSPSAMMFKRRSFEMLGVEKFDNRLADGLQIVRYEPGEAYITHHDYFPLHETRNHNWDPRNGGTNRYATIFLYLNDVEEGGQTVFPKANVPRDEDEEVESMNSSSLGDDIFTDLDMKNSSWERQMVDVCYR